MREQKITTKDKDGKKGKKCTLRTTNYTEKKRGTVCTKEEKEEQSIIIYENSRTLSIFSWAQMVNSPAPMC